MSGTPTSGVDYAERILGAQPTERQRAEVSQAMLRHGIAPDHPMLGVICEMILYRDQMDKYVARMEGASKVANDARAIISDREKKIEAHLANISTRMAEMEQEARKRLEQPLRSFENEMKERREAQERELQESTQRKLREISKIDLETRTLLNEAAWRTALSFRWGAILAVGGLCLGLGLGVGGGWGLWHPPRSYTEATCEAAGGTMMNLMGGKDRKDITGYRCAFPTANDLPPPPLPPASSK